MKIKLHTCHNPHATDLVYGAFNFDDRTRIKNLIESGLTYEAKLININYYELEDGQLVHVFNAMEVDEKVDFFQMLMSLVNNSFYGETSGYFHVSAKAMREVREKLKKLNLL